MRYSFTLALLLFHFITTSQTSGLAPTPIQEASGGIQLSVDELPSFRKVYVNTVSEVQFYDLQATGLSGSMVLQAQYPLMISLHCHDDFQEQLLLTPSNGAVEERIYVRVFPETTGNFQAIISHSSQGHTPRQLTTHAESIESQVPPLYYSTATGSGRLLKTQLHNIIKDHNTQTYASLWSHFVQTDATFSGKVWDMYSDIPCQEPPYIFEFGVDQDTGSGGNTEGDVFNREHSMPRSWFGGAVNPMNTDLYHIFPVDKHVNAVRDNWPYGRVNNPGWTSQNGSRLGPNAAGGTYTGTAFEPIDAYKGDLARAFLYMITRYEDRIENWTYSEEGNNMFDHNTYPGYKPWVIELLLEWHNLDPVSHKERMRNDAVFQIQGNRNPFVDHPEFVEKIWGDTTLTTGKPGEWIYLNLYPNPSKGLVQWTSAQTINQINTFTIDGRVVQMLTPHSTQGIVNLYDFPAGVYIVRFRSGNHMTQKRVVLH